VKTEVLKRKEVVKRRRKREKNILFHFTRAKTTRSFRRPMASDREAFFYCRAKVKEEGEVYFEKRAKFDMILEEFGQGSRSWNSSIEDSIRRRIRWVFLS